MAAKYSRSLSDSDPENHMQSEIDDVSTSLDDLHIRWQKKVIRARVMLGVLTAICCILLVILIITYESTRKHDKSCVPTLGRTPSNDDIMKFVHLADIHYDPFYNKTISRSNFCRSQGASNDTAKYIAEYGRIGCDSPASLIGNTLDAIKNVSVEEDVSFVLLTGDFSGHRMWTQYAGPQRVLDNIAYVSNQTHLRFSDIPVFPVVGNNDLPGHYVLPNSTSDWYKKLLSYWEPLILCSGCPGSVKQPTTQAVLEKSFLEGGYYKVSIAGGKMVLLVLNSLYWSAYVGGSVDIVGKAKRQLEWLETQLELAKSQGQKVMLAGHIPAGIDTYSNNPYWLSNYTNSFVSLVAKKYGDIVVGQFFSHTHKDDFRLHIPAADTSAPQQDSAKSFALLAPAISPVYQNNPAFRVMSLDMEQLSLLDYSQYYMDLVMATEFSNPVWQLDYIFSEKYSSSNKFLNADRIDELNQQLINQTSHSFWKGYVFSRETNYQPMPYSRFNLYCAMRFVHLDDFNKCIGKYVVPGG